MRSFTFAARVCALAAGLIVTASPATAATPAAAGKRALLTLNIQIDGAGERVSRSDGVSVKWTTHRVLNAKVELVAEKAQGTASADVKAQVAAAAENQPSADMVALQKEIEKCKDNTACQMAVAMKMAQTDDAKKMMAQDEAAQAAPPRYQTWQALPKTGRVEATGEYQEQWDGVFLTASREVRTCKSAYSSAAPNAATTVKDRETLQTGLTGVRVEVDTRTGTSSLLMVAASFVAGELKCHINDGGRVSDERENRNLSLVPNLNLDSTGYWLAGGSAVGPAISRGDVNFTTKSEARSITGMMSVSAPLGVKIHWELTPL
jgi:hypothetical protein